METSENKVTWHKNETQPKTESSTLAPTNHHIKLWLKTLNNLAKHPYENAAVFGAQNISYVDLVATVVDKFSYSKADIYVCKEICSFHFHFKIWLLYW